MRFKRLYPEYIPRFVGEPTENEFEVKEVEGIGKALFSKKLFEVGTEVFTFSGILLPYITQWTLEINANVHIEDKFAMGLVAHSCEPNCYVDMNKMKFIAIREIRNGEKITMDYSQTESKLFANFICGCGSDKCRGQI